MAFQYVGKSPTRHRVAVRIDKDFRYCNRPSDSQPSTAHRAGRLKFFGQHQHITDADAFAEYLAPLREIDWVAYAKRPFSGPKAVLTYLSRYTHRVAISNCRLIDYDAQDVTFK